MNPLRMFIPMALIILLSPLPLVYGQPQGYVLIYSPPRAYNVDWMDVKAVYMKEEGDKLYFYIEYYGAIPSSEDYERHISIYIDVDRNPQTGDIDRGLGVDYTIDLYLSGGHARADLFKGGSTGNNLASIIARVAQHTRDLTSNMRMGLNYMEVWVDKRDIGYTQNGIDFYILSGSDVWLMLGTELNYVIGSSVKKIKVDGDSNDWGSVSPSITFPPRSINPPELEISSIYVANDDENLYFRIDTRDKPTTMVNEGTLYRDFLVCLDIDNNNNTGFTTRVCGGAEFEVFASFSAKLSKRTYVVYHRYGMEIDEWHEIENSSDFNNIFEFKVPLSLLGLGSGQTIGIHIFGRGGLVRSIPQSGYLTCYPDMAPLKSRAQSSNTIQLFTILIPLVIVAVAASILLRKRMKAEREERILKALLSD